MKTNKHNKQIEAHKTNNFSKLNNQTYLIRTLRLLGVHEVSFFKQTKANLKCPFPNNQVNPSCSKQFFYITQYCLKKLASEEEMQTITMWYPPRNTSEQLQFKKYAYKLIRKLQTVGLLPSNTLITKNALSADRSIDSILEFLCILSEMALRNLYLQKYSKIQRLIQIPVSIFKNELQNDINQFYVYPFTPTKTTSQIPHNVGNLGELKQIYSIHINNYWKKILKLKTIKESSYNVINPQKIMGRLLEQRQMAETLKLKVPKEMLSENRRFDRRRLIDRTEEIWKELRNVPSHDAYSNNNQVLKIKGEVHQVLQNWQTVPTMANLHHIVSDLTQKHDFLKHKCKENLKNFNELKNMIKIQLQN